MSSERTDSPDDRTPPEDDAVARLIHFAGTRTAPSEHEVALIKRAALERWEQLMSRRRRRALVRRLQIAAVLVLAIGLGVWQTGVLTPGGRVVGQVQLADHQVRMLDGSQSSTLHTGDEILSRRDLSTGPDGHIAILLSSGIGLRLDRGTRIRLVAADRIRLDDGRIYVDTSAAANGARIEIETRQGVVRHLGTRFAVVDVGDDVHVQGREGLVEVTRRSDRWQAEAGTQLVLSTRGAVEQLPLATHGPTWAWVIESSPGFALEGATLGAFLDWVIAETGWTLELEVEDSQALLAHRLHGSLDGLTIDESLALVLTGSGLTSELDSGRLRVLER